MESDNAGCELQAPPGGHATGKAPKVRVGRGGGEKENPVPSPPDDTSAPGGHGLCLDPTELLVLRWPVRMLSRTGSYSILYSPA